MRLKSRQKYIPNGFRFLQPETGWKSTPNASFDSIVQSLINHRKGRPDLVAKHGWSLDHEVVANEVEKFNVRICVAHGWTDYLDGAEGGLTTIPKSKPPTAQEKEQLSAAAGRASKIWAGVRTITDWIDSGADPVAQEVAERRAFICSKCPKNTKGDFTSFFTAPAAGVIKRQVEQLQGRKLTTKLSNELNICDVCLCPLKLKVHTPISFIKQHMSDEVLAKLKGVEGCWIPAELGK